MINTLIGEKDMKGESMGKPPIPDYNYDNYDDQYMQHGDTSVFWKKGKK